jgi:anti-sigma-K factor RskA
MSADRNLILELIDAVALGIAEPEEIELVETVAAADPEVAAALREARDAVEVLALSVPQTDPSWSMKRSLMQTVHEEAAREGPAVAQAPTRRREPSRDGRSWLPRFKAWPAAAVALAALAAVLLVWNLNLRGDDEPAGAEVASIIVTGTPDAPQARGEITIIPSRDTAIVELSDLPPAAEGQGYELWTLRGDTPTSAGFLEPGGDDSVRGVASIDDVDALAVTLEPLTNRSAPTSDPLVVSTLPDTA